MNGEPFQDRVRPSLIVLCRVARREPGRFCLDQAAQSGRHGNGGPRRQRSGAYLPVEDGVFPQATGVCLQLPAGEVRSGWETRFTVRAAGEPDQRLVRYS